MFFLQAKETKFVFPDLFPSDVAKKTEDDSKSLDEAKEIFKKFKERNKHRPGTPAWFTS